MIKYLFFCLINHVKIILYYENYSSYTYSKGVTTSER